MMKTYLSVLAVVFAFILSSAQANTVFAASHPPIPTSEVAILLDGYHHDNEPIVGLEKTSADKWGAYRAGGRYSKEEQIVKFFPVPYGIFRVWIVTWNCGVTEGNFNFGEGVKKVEITFDARGCLFTTFKFSAN